MDAVAIYFKGAVFSQVESIASKHGVPSIESVYLRTYPEWESEASDEEKQKIDTLLGDKPTCAVLIESRQGSSARRALLLASDLMTSLAPAVLDDDADGFWSAQDVRQLLEASEQNTIYSLRGARG